MLTTQERARSYTCKMPPSISGSGGHPAAFKVAVALVKGFSLSQEDALPLMSDWNMLCTPPWSESDLRHKLRSAANSAQKQDGYLLKDTPRTNFAPRRVASVTNTKTDSESKERKRLSWPTIMTPTKSDIEAIATLRNLPCNAVDLCATSGFIGMADIDKHPCFIIGEGIFAQARRMDGQPILLKNGERVKAKNLAGSEGAFISQRWLGETPRILLVEGVIALLEATAAILLSDRTDWTVLAATSAGSRFTRDPALLARLKGRHVRIIPDNDKAGQGHNAAASWLSSLRDAGAIVDVFALPDGFKDLGSIVAAPETHHQLIISIFN
ncbi:hypothetical protein BH11VER1_BH11VER1_22960 [soil metagenome]